MNQDLEKISDREIDKNIRDKFGVLSYILSNLARHRWRTVLTVSGIAVPIAIFILFAAMGHGLELYIDEQTVTLDKESYLEISKIVNAWTNVLLGILAIMIITLIANTILMSTTERKFEFGVLKAIGISNEQIIFLVLLEGFIISSLALIIGVILGFWFTIAFDHLFWLGGGAWLIFSPAQITLNSIIIATILTLLIGTVTAIYPALSISRLNTIDILRAE